MKSWIALCLFATFVCAPLGAAIDAPDHVIYGNATLYGVPAPKGLIIEARLASSGGLLIRHELARDTRLGQQYALRIPMDTVNPRLEGLARPGDPIEIFLGGVLAANTVVGAVGLAVRLDIDPQNLGSGPSITVSDAEVFEGNSGITPMVFEASLNTTSDEVVSAAWQTVDDTAIGGTSCGPGVDYISASGRLEFVPGSMNGSIMVGVCGNTVIQPTRQLLLQFSDVQNGVLVRGQAIGVIIDDDDIPDLRMADVTTIKPDAGQTSIAIFRPSLTKSSDYAVRFTYQTEALTALPDVDFVSVSGEITIEPGDLTAEISVPILSADGITPPRDFLVELSAPFNVHFERSSALGRISDARFNPAVELAQEVVDGDENVVGIARPTALAIAPNGVHVYVSSEALDAITLFHRTVPTGRLQHMVVFDEQLDGMAGAQVDGPLDVQLSPDGLNLYVASSKNDAVVVLTRDPDSGGLTFLQRIGTGVVPGLAGVRKLTLSQDGRHLYAAGAIGNAVVVFERDESDGHLSHRQTVSNCNAGPAECDGLPRGLVRPAGLALSSNGDQLYVASRFGNAVQVFSRQDDTGESGFGELSLLAEYRSGLAGIVDLDGAFDIVISPDDAQVYVTAEARDAVAMFNRNADGTLIQRFAQRHASPEVPGLRGPQGLALSPDGDRLYVTGFVDSTVTIFDRSLTDGDGDRLAGDLQVRQTVFGDQGGIESMGGPTRIVASSDDRHIYVVANTDNAIVVLRRLPIREEDDRVFRDRFEIDP